MQRKSPAVKNRVYIAQNIPDERLDQSFQLFCPKKSLQYRAFCDDFGPLNLASIVDFVIALDLQLESDPESKIAFMIEKGKRNLTNAVFLLGSYMILKEGMTPAAVSLSFGRLDPRLIESYRDATFSNPRFKLSLLDCWRGLSKAKHVGWLEYSSIKPVWGKINMQMYQHYDNTNNGDLHEVVPGKFVAFRGPVDVGGREYLDMPNGLRLFSPSYYADVLRDMGVSTIIRLNEPRYDAAAFTSHGYEHFDLEFGDCTAPPDDIVAAFFRIVDSAPGAVAVHCLAGLGRTGTLIALYLMRRRGFTAREAIAWLRIMRPGSVIGEQQHYLCAACPSAAAYAAAAAAASAVTTPAPQNPTSSAPAPRRGSLQRLLCIPRSRPARPAAAGPAGEPGPGPSRGSSDPVGRAEAAALAAQLRAGMVRRSSSRGAAPNA